MSAPLTPSPLDYVGRRRFAFYPPIAHIDPNEWLLGVGDRSEVQVVNAQTGREIWVSRQYIGAVSETSSPLLIVGLTKALDFRGGSVEPRVKQIIEMPPAAGIEEEAINRSPTPASVVEIRLESRADSAFNKAVLATCICAIVLALLAGLVTAAIRF
ncbi:MAG: hypothetical protein JO210_12445 [Acidobacteriaceae bacterium]|nr:hypothetical protein [Acidobacteriaceae bacterium]